MTDQEIEKLREKLGDGFEVTAGYNCAVITVKDIWDGVEFIERPTCQGKYEKICKVEEILTDVIAYRCSRQGRVAGYKNELKPSTESAYVEQLKAKAHELYGEIKDGDRFDISMLEEDPQDFRMFYDNPIFTYYKKDDSLWAGNHPIYKQGKWAKKVERVRVEGTWTSYNNDRLNVMFEFDYKGSDPNPVELSAHLAKCLEDYLNNS